MKTKITENWYLINGDIKESDMTPAKRKYHGTEGNVVSYFNSEVPFELAITNQHGGMKGYAELYLINHSQGIPENRKEKNVSLMRGINTQSLAPYKSMKAEAKEWMKRNPFADRRYEWDMRCKVCGSCFKADISFFNPSVECPICGATFEDAEGDTIPERMGAIFENYNTRFWSNIEEVKGISGDDLQELKERVNGKKIIAQR